MTTHRQLLVLFGLMSCLIGAPAWAAGTSGDPNKPQEMQAIKHTQKAVEVGKAGKADEMRKHAETALQIAEAADKMKSEDHIKEGIKHLRMAVDMSKQGNAEEGTAHAEEALKSLQKH